MLVLTIAYSLRLLILAQLCGILNENHLREMNGFYKEQSVLMIVQDMEPGAEMRSEKEYRRLSVCWTIYKFQRFLKSIAKQFQHYIH